MDTDYVIRPVHNEWRIEDRRSSHLGDPQSSILNLRSSSAERQPLNGHRVLPGFRVILDAIPRRVIAGFLIFRRYFDWNRYVRPGLQKSFGYHWFEEDHAAIITSINECMGESLAVKFVRVGFYPVQPHARLFRCRRRNISFGYKFHRQRLATFFQIVAPRRDPLSFSGADQIEMKVEMRNFVDSLRVISLRIPVQSNV